MQTRFFQGLILGLVLVGATAGGCSDSSNPPADTGAPDVSADTGGDDVTSDVATDTPAPQDVARDAAPEDVARDAAQDTAPPTDVATDTGPAPDVATDTGPADVSTSDGGLAERCTASGGTVGMSLCCASVSDFPNLCTTGACGCAPTSSRMVMVCNCPEGRCFNGTACAPR
jgi:hypothetical protein